MNGTSKVDPETLPPTEKPAFPDPPLEESKHPA
jgi:hypothetical protein